MIVRGLLLCCALLLATAVQAADSAEAVRQQVLVLLQLPPAHYSPDRQYAGGYAAAPGRTARRAIASDLARRHGLTLVDDWPLPALGVDCYVLAVPPSQAPAEVAETLAHDARVVWAQPMHLFRARGHDDPLFPVQPANLAWRLADLHELATGRGVTVAVIDSGVDGGHPDLLGQLAGNVNFVDGRPVPAERHGTAVAGIVAARADNHVGIAGIAPRAQVLALRGCWQAAEATLCSSLSLAKALHQAVTQGAAVINLSVGGPPDRLLAQLLDQAVARGAVVVAAVERGQPGGGFPASHAGVVAVSDDAAAGMLSAPGRDVPAPAPGARWDFVSGSSYASAHVAGLFALLRELGPTAPEPVARLVRNPDGSIDTCATLLRASPHPKPGACALALAAQAAARP